MSNLTTQLSNYSFENHQIRTMLRNGEIWFIARDVCDAVKISNVTDALIKLDDEEKATIGLTDSQGGIGAQRISIVSESGMYTLILRCRDAVKKDTAPYRFRKWVTSKVLPTIRKTGSYSLTINTEQQQMIKRAVQERSFRTSEHYQAIYTKLYEYFKIPRYQDLPAVQFDNAIKFLGGISKLSKLSDEDWFDIAWLYKVADKAINEIIDIEPALRAVKSTKAPLFWSLGHDNKSALIHAKRILERETAHISDKGFNNKWSNLLAIIRHKPKGVINFADDIAYLD